MIKPIVFVLLSALLAGCSANPTVVHELIGETRPAVSPAEVLLIQQAPDYFQEIGMISAQSPKSSTSLNDSVTDELIELLKAEAAKLGANAVVLTHLSDEQSTVKVNSFDGIQGGVREEARIQRIAQGLAIYIE